MAHPRKLIRHAVAALLIAAGTAAGDRVRPTRVEPHKKGGLPALGVYTLNDRVNEDASSATEDAHELELELVGWVKHTDDEPADDAMDELAEQVEAAMRGDPYLGSLAHKEVRLVETLMEVVEVDGRSDPTVGVVVLTYAVEYRTSKVASADDLEDFRSVDAKHRVVGAVEGNQARDVFNVQETTP